MSELGVERARAAALGCLVYPPPTSRTDLPWWEWMFHVQVASALVLARLDTGWRSGPREQALTALVRGPVDWVATAALVAVAQIAEREPDARADAIELLSSALDLRPMSPVVFMCLVEPSVQLLRRMQYLPAALHARVDRLHDELDLDAVIPG